MELHGKEVTLVGLGRSSVAAAQLLLREGARPFITEMGDSRSLAPWREACCDLDIPYEVGGHSDKAFDRPDLIVISPGVPPDAACLNAVRRRSVPVTGELELAWRYCNSTTLAVTGTNGKTTVTALLEAMIASGGSTVALAGNNDTPLSLVALRDPQPEYVVIEVSSYQLQTTDRFHPVIAAVLNITPDHLGRHGGMDQYAATKARIVMRQGAGDAVIRNADDPLVMALPAPPDVRSIQFSMERKAPDTFFANDDAIYFGDAPVARVTDNPLPGKHNMANVLAALAMVHAGGFDWDGALAGLRAFKGVEHRIEFVMSLDGTAYYNDSKSTNLDSLRVALESFDASIVLIAGGRGKGSDYASLRAVVERRVKQIIAIGEDAPLLAAAYGSCVPVIPAASMMDAVRRAHGAAAAGDVVLLSPACASFDMYDNFEARGRDFKECLTLLADALSAVKENVQ